MAMDKNTYVTQPSLPPLEEFIPYLEKIWKNKILTNGGKFHQDLEIALCEYLGVKYISLFNNGTVALMVALKALNLNGEVITTPYSFIATSHAIMWNNLEPVFADIDLSTMNLDPKAIERAITPQTSAILPVHCYGNPCNVKEIKKIAEKYNLKVIYDAAHAFGVKDVDGSILNHGDLSVLSFHATKVFNTFEGGAIVSSTLKMKEQIDRLKNFGYDSEISISDVGLNGKMSEVNAAFGLVQLNYVRDAILAREKLDAVYRSGLSGVKGIQLLEIPKSVTSNFSYFPIVIEPGYSLTRDELHALLLDEGIVSRKYFYPLISQFDTYKNRKSSSELNLPVATNISSQILCLPIYPNLDPAIQKIIINIIANGRK